MEHVDETGEKKKKSRLGNVLVRKSLVRIFTREVQQDKESASDIAAHWDRKKAERSGSAWNTEVYHQQGGFITGFHTCEHIACYEVFPLVRRA